MTMVAESTTPGPASGLRRSPATGEYVPGVCNIGPAEIARRRRAGHVFTLLAIGLLAALVAIGAPSVARLFVGLPAAAAAICYLEARLRFCAGLATLGVFNFGEPGHTEAVGDPADRARDRAMVVRMTVAGVLIGLAVGAIAAALPL